MTVVQEKPMSPLDIARRQGVLTQPDSEMWDQHVVGSCASLRGVFDAPPAEKPSRRKDNRKTCKVVRLTEKQNETLARGYIPKGVDWDTVQLTSEQARLYRKACKARDKRRRQKRVAARRRLRRIRRNEAKLAS